MDMRDDIAHVRTRFLLQRHQELRRRAVADFILSTAQTAVELRRCLESRANFGKPSKPLDEAIAYLEAEIQKRFRETFGRELFNEPIAEN